jgi:putative redox protein
MGGMGEEEQMATVIVRDTGSGFAQDVAVGRHRLTADEPEADGGTDTGPSPYDYLLVALGA